MLTFLFILLVGFILYFVCRKLIQQRLIIYELERKLKRRPVEKKKKKGGLFDRFGREKSNE